MSVIEFQPYSRLTLVMLVNSSSSFARSSLRRKLHALLSLALLLPFSFGWVLCSQLRGAETAGSRSAWEADPKGWVDLLPPADLNGWYRVPVPPTGKLGRDQWHVDSDKKLLI